MTVIELSKQQLVVEDVIAPLGSMLPPPPAAPAANGRLEDGAKSR